jgi:ABC-type multidrug transport system fused ATPase/permease subunit
MVYAQVHSSLAGGERIYAILDEERDQEDARDAVVLQEVAGRIEFDGVHFAYQPGNDVLHDINFSIEAGQTAAIVGRTGAGKTTIAGLVPRFYDVTVGAVRIDGHDVRGVKRASLREQTAMVLQESFLFSGTVADNIAYRREGATRGEIELAAQTVCADTFIAELPQGYDTHSARRA